MDNRFRRSHRTRTTNVERTRTRTIALERTRSRITDVEGVKIRRPDKIKEEYKIKNKDNRIK
jgi:KaiC/GvpD/RAD55 family RecA-like ATPase